MHIAFLIGVVFGVFLTILLMRVIELFIKERDFFWGGALILVGILLFLNTYNYLELTVNFVNSLGK